MIRGKAPLRISFAGGGTDLNYIFEKYGGAVVSCTIDKYCHMSIEKRKDGEVFINNKPIIALDETDEHLVAKVYEYYQPTFGFNLTYYNDVEPGSGLGSSSSFVVLLLRLLYELDNKVVTDEQLVQEAYKIETSFKEGGWQDQYATAIGGFNFMEFGQKNVVYPLRLKYSFICDLNEHFILVKTGEKGNSDTHKQVREDENELERTKQIKYLAFQMRDCLLNQRIEDIPKILNNNWHLKRNKHTTNNEIDSLYNVAMSNGAQGGKLCGSGKGGHFLFFVKPENRNRLINAMILTKREIVNFNFHNHGVETWQS